MNGLNGRPALVRFFRYRSEAELRPGDILYRGPHSKVGSLPSRTRDYWDKRGEPGFNQADPRHDYHHMALYLGRGEVAQAGGDRRGDVVLAGPRSYGVRITRFDTRQWAPEAGRPLRLIHPQAAKAARSHVQMIHFPTVKPGTHMLGTHVNSAMHTCSHFTRPISGYLLTATERHRVLSLSNTN